MSQDQGAAAASGCLIAAIVVVVLVVCGGGALVVAGALFFVRDTQRVQSPPPPVASHADVLAIEADGTLLWNNEQVMTTELAKRLDELESAAGPPRSVIVRTDPQAPPQASEQVLRMLGDRGVAFIMEDPR